MQTAHFRWPWSLCRAFCKNLLFPELLHSLCNSRIMPCITGRRTRGWCGPRFILAGVIKRESRSKAAIADTFKFKRGFDDQNAYRSVRTSRGRNRVLAVMDVHLSPVSATSAPRHQEGQLLPRTLFERAFAP